VPDPLLLRDHGLFVAEGRLVVQQLLRTPRLRVHSLLVTDAALESVGVGLRQADAPVYVAPQRVLNEIVGFNIHRGCLALGVRPDALGVRDFIQGDDLAAPSSAISRLVVLEAVSNVDNIGGIFRSTAALGGHGIVLGPGCGDPLYRKAIRTSIGATLRLPYASATSWPDALDDLRAAGFTLAALTPRAHGQPLEDVAADLRARPRIALLLGTEGDGLSARVIDRADLLVRIPMAAGADSLNVTTAAAIALYRVV